MKTSSDPRIGTRWRVAAPLASGRFRRRKPTPSRTAGTIGESGSSRRTESRPRRAACSGVTPRLRAPAEGVPGLVDEEDEGPVVVQVPRHRLEAPVDDLERVEGRRGRERHLAERRQLGHLAAQRERRLLDLGVGRLDPVHLALGRRPLLLEEAVLLLPVVPGAAAAARRATTPRAGRRASGRGERRPRRPREGPGRGGPRVPAAPARRSRSPLRAGVLPGEAPLAAVVPARLALQLVHLGPGLARGR